MIMLAMIMRMTSVLTSMIAMRIVAVRMPVPGFYKLGFITMLMAVMYYPNGSEKFVRFGNVARGFEKIVASAKPECLPIPVRSGGDDGHRLRRWWPLRLSTLIREKEAKHGRHTALKYAQLDYA
jgi:hypothetical protein